jgi:hypothetical protein
MVKEKKVVKVGVSEPVVASVIKPEIKVKEAPTSDMWELYNQLGNRLEEEDIVVNGSVPPFVEIGTNFVDNCEAMIVANIGPHYSPYVFVARVTCIVAKGQETGLRLEILKNAVRATLKEPFRVRKYVINAVVTNEGDERVIGARKSELTISMSATKLRRR